MTGSLPPGGRASAFLEVPEAADEQKPDLPAGVSLTWLPRNGRPAGDPAALAAALQAAELPPGTGHFYLFGEARVVLALREVLAARGVPGEQVSAKAYWGRGKANAQHGEPGPRRLTAAHPLRPAATKTGPGPACRARAAARLEPGRRQPAGQYRRIAVHLDGRVIRRQPPEQDQQQV